MPDTITGVKSERTLDDWLYYLEQQHPVHEIKLGLERVLHVAARADLHLLPGKVVLIAGTNGKGTTARALEVLLLAQGFSVGVYSSPHLLKFNERLRINQHDVTDGDWIAALSFVEQLRAETALTYFEFTTLAAFSILKQQQPDICLIEVGLGGRLDATNIISPDVSVITSIDLDHQDWLGHDREAIGYEKAGIFRPDKPAVVGELAVPQTVLDHASALNCRQIIVNQHYHYQQYGTGWSWSGQKRNYAHLPCAAVPVQNMATALAVLEQLDLLPDEATTRQVLSDVRLAGRLQWLQNAPAVIIDVAHNPQSARYLASQLQQMKPQQGRIVALVGMLKDKDIRQTLLPLTSLFEQWHLVSLGGARGASADYLVKMLDNIDPQAVFLHHEVVSAFRQIISQLQPEDMLVVFGSFVTVSAILASYQQEEV